MTEFTKAMLDKVLAEVYAKGNQPTQMFVDPKIAAGMRALEKFEGRDRRRLKREWNKAWRLERERQLALPKPPKSSDPLGWWRHSTATPTSETT